MCTLTVRTLLVWKIRTSKATYLYPVLDKFLLYNKATIPLRNRCSYFLRKYLIIYIVKCLFQYLTRSHLLIAYIIAVLSIDPSQARQAQLHCYSVAFEGLVGRIRTAIVVEDISRNKIQFPSRQVILLNKNKPVICKT